MTTTGHTQTKAESGKPTRTRHEKRFRMRKRNKRGRGDPLTSLPPSPINAAGLCCDTLLIRLAIVCTAGQVVVVADSLVVIEQKDERESVPSKRIFPPIPRVSISRSFGLVGSDRSAIRDGPTRLLLLPPASLPLRPVCSQ